MKALKIKKLKAKESSKLHTERAEEAKTELRMYGDKLKPDVAESEGHFKLAWKLDAETDVFKKAAWKEARKLAAE